MLEIKPLVVTKAGAVGGKLAGAGSGGFLALLVHEKNQAAVRTAMRALPEVAFGLFDQRGDGHQCGGVVPLRGGYPPAGEFEAVIIQRDDLYLGAAKVNANS